MKVDILDPAIARQQPFASALSPDETLEEGAGRNRSRSWDAVVVIRCDKPAIHAIATTARPAVGHGMHREPQSGAIPFSASSLIAFAFLARCASPMPRNTFGVLENWMLS
jgi:hypothetical protein